MSMLAEGLSGLVTSPSTISLKAPPARAYTAAALRHAPTTSVKTFIGHLKEVVRDLITTVEIAEPGPNLPRLADKIRSLTFALASGLSANRMQQNDEDELWSLTTNLWVISFILPLFFTRKHILPRNFIFYFLPFLLCTTERQPRCQLQPYHCVSLRPSPCTRQRHFPSRGR